MHAIPRPIAERFAREFAEDLFREDWFTAYNRVHSNPAASITAGRTMLETILKTIVSERGETPDTSGAIGALLKQAEKLLCFDKPEHQHEHQIVSGFGIIWRGEE